MITLEEDTVLDHSFVFVPPTCTRCILNTNDDPHITFNAEGVCNHCTNFDTISHDFILPDEVRIKKLNDIVSKIKRNGTGKKYDCILGISGGIDSTFLAYHAKKLGLRPLVVHFDNGWNSELAVKNIENTLKRLGLDLYTYVVNWDEFRDLQLSYIKASVLDWEVPTDHGISALLWHSANKYKIKYILTGMNQDFDFVEKKFGLTHDEFLRYFNQPNRNHLDFRSYETNVYVYHRLLFSVLSPFIRFIKSIIALVK